MLGKIWKMLMIAPQGLEIGENMTKPFFVFFPWFSVMKGKETEGHNYFVWRKDPSSEVIISYRR